jgi:hypothetical protein
MKILVLGDRNRLKKHKKFSCIHCGCIFLADNTEYKDESTQRDGALFTVNCPYCGRPAWTNTYDCVETIEHLGQHGYTRTILE